MKAILINAKTRDIKEVSVGDYKEMYVHLECSMFQVGTELPNQDSIFVDEEGLINGTEYFFTYKDAHQPFAGNGLVMGCNDDGESVDCKIELNEVKSNVKFYDKTELIMAVAMGEIKIY